MELLQLTYFCHAANCENFSKTAEYYNVPTSNISRAIRSLERELGVKLFSRSANKVSLNDQGKGFYQSVKQALTILESGKRSLRDEESAECGEIRLLISTCRRIVTRAIEKCRAQFPHIKFFVKHGCEDENYDFIISDVPPSKKSFDKIHLLTERMLLAIPESSRLFVDSEPAEHLDNEPFISLGKGTRLHSLTEQFCAARGFVPNITMQTDDPYYVRKYLEMGLGVAIFPEKSWGQMISPEIKLSDVGFPDRQIFVFREKGKTMTKAETTFLEILVSTFSEV